MAVSAMSHGRRTWARRPCYVEMKIALVCVCLCVTARVRAGESPEQFAKDEIRYYTGQMQVHGRMVDVTVDPKMGPSEAVSIESDDSHIKIVGSNGFTALAGAYQFLGCGGVSIFVAAF